MKKLIKNSMLALTLLIATQSYSNIADSIIITDDNSKLVKIEKLKAGSTLKIKDEFGTTLHKEMVEDSEYNIKKFDLSNLPDATYYFELDNADEIRTIPVVIKDQKAESLISEESRIEKPRIKKDGQMVYLQQNSNKEQDTHVSIYYEGKELALEESFKNSENINRSYDFSGSLKGDYTIVINTGGKSFSNKINIDRQ